MALYSDHLANAEYPAPVDVHNADADAQWAPPYIATEPGISIHTQPTQMHADVGMIKGFRARKTFMQNVKNVFIFLFNLTLKTSLWVNVPTLENVCNKR